MRPSITRTFAGSRCGTSRSSWSAVGGCCRAAPAPVPVPAPVPAPLPVPAPGSVARPRVRPWPRMMCPISWAMMWSWCTRLVFSCTKM
ncbi:hypothetical protein CP980_10850 [Streptomyces vinaceus]|uniref:Uncharacterized protein n=1 Tax=Streptomyces vinaceus TaxID=1960 RepID=A0A5J6JCP4_STRVI|nr:hypothetical protein CP980_10850 [Streptomyces vinaceus]